MLGIKQTKVDIIHEAEGDGGEGGGKGSREAIHTRPYTTRL